MVSFFPQNSLQYFTSALQICDNEIIDRFASYITNDIPLNISGILYNITLETNRTLIYSKWNNRLYFTNYIFKYVLTDEGVCHQFNGLQTTDIYRNTK